VTLASVTTAPDASRTVPTTAAVSNCAAAVLANANTNAATAKPILRMEPPENEGDTSGAGPSSPRIRVAEPSDQAPLVALRHRV
jgi:hypothetical protein